MTTTPTSLLSTSLLSTSLLIQSTRQTLIKCQSMNKTRPSGGSRRSIVGRQSSYFIIQEASQLNVTPGMSHGVEVSAVSAWLSVSHITVFYYELTESHFSSYCFKQVYRRWYESHRSSKPKQWMEFLHAAMWHDHDIDFARWLHPAMWHVVLESWQWIAIKFARWQHPAMWHIALGSWHWIRQVAAPCTVAGGSGMTCHGIRWIVSRIGILHLVSILTISPQSTCHSAPVCKILSKSDHPQQKNDVMSIFKMAVQ